MRWVSEQETKQLIVSFEDFARVRDMVPLHDPTNCLYCETHGNEDDHVWFFGRLICLERE